MPRLSRLALLLAAALGLAGIVSAQNDPSWTAPFAPFRVAGNLYYVGTRGVSSFLFVTPAGNILLDTGVEEAVPLVVANIEKLGFKAGDIKILLASHAHFDHVGGHAAMQQRTSATVMALGDDATALSSGVDGSALGGPGWKPVKVGRVLRDGDIVTLGGVTLTAHLTPGHTKGCTTWTTTVQQDGKTYRVVLIGGTSINAGVTLTNNTRHPRIIEDYARTFTVLRDFSPDIFLAQHPNMFRMEDKVKRRLAGEANVFVDPQGYRAFVEAGEKAYQTQLARERGTSR